MSELIDQQTKASGDVMSLWGDGDVEDDEAWLDIEPGF